MVDVARTLCGLPVSASPAQTDEPIETQRLSGAHGTLYLMAGGYVSAPSREYD